MTPQRSAVSIGLLSVRPDTEHVLALPVAPGGLLGGDRFGEQVRAAAAVLASSTAPLLETVADAGQGARRIVLFRVEDPQVGPSWEVAGGHLARHMLALDERELVVDFSGVATTPTMARLALGVALRGWRNERHLTGKGLRTARRFSQLSIVDAGSGFEAGWARTSAIVDGVCFARWLISEPPNSIDPAGFVDACRPLADLGLQVRVLDLDQIEALGMGAFLAVGQGAATEPKLIVLEWDGTGGRADAATIALVGKGVTFDSGGLSLKTAADMELMKLDMAGAAAVAGTLVSLALRGADARVVGVCGVVENMPDSRATRPGDIVTAMGGLTVEVVNTDAEGRLVLCDALTWVQQEYRPTVAVDIATLTRSVALALGDRYAGLFTPDERLAADLSCAGLEVGERLWRLPVGPEYDAALRSDIADLRNRGPREAGAITAARFLSRFIEDGVRWAHIDIAGVAWAAAGGVTRAEGATGFGVRLLDQFIADVAEAS